MAMCFLKFSSMTADFFSRAVEGRVTPAEAQMVYIADYLKLGN
jgi:hypothetical protein